MNDDTKPAAPAAVHYVPAEMFDVSKAVRGEGACEVACAAIEKRFSTSAKKHFFGLRTPVPFAVEIPIGVLRALPAPRKCRALRAQLAPLREGGGAKRRGEYSVRCPPRARPLRRSTGRGRVRPLPTYPSPLPAATGAFLQ